MDVWQSVVEANNKKDKDGSVLSDETTLLFVGSKKSGKTTVIYRFLNRDEQPKPTLALEYTFGRQNRNNLLSKDVCHIWELGGGTLFTHLLEFSLKPNVLLNASVAVVLDLSMPEELVATLTAILDSIRSWLDRVLSTTEAKQAKLTETLTNLALKRFGTDHPDINVIKPMLVPLIIIGGKYDAFQNLEPEQRKVACRTLRYFAHMNGATLQFFSLKMENLVNRTRVIMSNAAFGTPVSQFISLDYTKPLAIPAGADSFQQIGSVQGDGTHPEKDPAIWMKTFEKCFPKTSKRSKMPEDPAKDPNFKEPIIDNLRLQRDNDLERFMKAT